MKSFVDFDWDEKRNVSLIKLHEFIHQPLPKLWDPPVADEDFVKYVCYNRFISKRKILFSIFFVSFIIFFFKFSALLLIVVTKP